MSRRRSHTLIISCLLFTGFFLASIDLGQGIKCYVCDSREDSKCLNDLGKLEECTETLATKPVKPTTESPKNPSDSTTESSSNSTTESSSDSTTESSSNSTTESSSDSTTESSDKPTTKQETKTTKLPDVKPFMDESYPQEPDFMFNGRFKTFDTSSGNTNETFECFLIIANTRNDSRQVFRGCSEKDTLNCNNYDAEADLANCDFKACDSDGCNSSNMEKMGIISLLLPVITMLLRIR